MRIVITSLEAIEMLKERICVLFPGMKVEGERDYNDFGFTITDPQKQQLNKEEE